MERRGESPAILIIDDQINTLELALTNLEMEGYRVITALNGESGFKIAQAELPDVIILDVMMPGLDGWEICRLLLDSERTHDIPILMLTAKTETKDIIKGLELGATEYLAKPFHVEEFLVRVKTLVRIRRTEEELKVLNNNLGKLVEEHTQKLIEAARFEALGKMAGSVGHDLINLLQNIQGENEMAQRSNDLEKIKKLLRLQEDSIAMMVNFSANLRAFSLDQEPEKIVFDPEEVVLTTVGIMERQLRESLIKTSIFCPEKIFILADKGQFFQMCLNLIINAKDAMNDGGELNISIERDRDFIRMCFQDTGCGIPGNNRQKIFDLMFTTKPEGQGTGIGLFAAKEVIERHNGRIVVESEEGEGSTFSFWLPAKRNIKK